ncbi:MAG: type II toxin-antitoxin system Phd/YefM family antitoxin [Alphaproteobacteria bacterium]|nr:type II toxin-antitoxin system Phd/YefM family antitoxin [Alphaproteobacteria bacterium]
MSQGRISVRWTEIPANDPPHFEGGALALTQKMRPWSSYGPSEIAMQVPVHAAKPQLSRLIDAVARGRRVVITRHGAPAADLVAARKARLRIGGLKGGAPPPPDGAFAPMDAAELGDWDAL